MKSLFMIAVVLLSSVTITAAQGAGKNIFTSKCSICHGPDGSGKTSMGKALNIADLHSEAVQKTSDADLRSIISNGKNKMPAFKGKLTDAQIDDVIAYIRSLAK